MNLNPEPHPVLAHAPFRELRADLHRDAEDAIRQPPESDRASDFQDTYDLTTSEMTSGEFLDCVSADIQDLKYGWDPEIFPRYRDKEYLIKRRPSQVEEDYQLATLNKVSHEPVPHTKQEVYANVMRLYRLEEDCRKADGKQQTISRVHEWRPLLKLHLTLLEHHHSLYMILQEIKAPHGLHEMIQRTSMPARMWRYGIGPFLQLLKMGKPASNDCMLSFVNYTYALIASLHEFVYPAFNEIWTVYLGELACCRMAKAIEDLDAEDAEIWGDVAISWFTTIVDKHPHSGLSYVYLGQAAPLNSLQRLAYYLESQICLVPFFGACSMISTIFQSCERNNSPWPTHTTEIAFINIHAKLFEQRQPTSQIWCLTETFHLSLLDDYIRGTRNGFYHQGVAIALTNIAALFEYGASRDNQSSTSLFRLHYLRICVQKEKTNHACDKDLKTALRLLAPPDRASALDTIIPASRITFTTLRVVLESEYGKNILPTVHVMLCFLWSLVSVEELLGLIEHDIPWSSICLFLNNLLKTTVVTSDLRTQAVPRPDDGFGLPLPEDFAIRGHVFALWYYPAGWFNGVPKNNNERLLESPSVRSTRERRILWLGFRIALVSTSSINLSL